MRIPKQIKATIAFAFSSLITQGLNLLVTPIFIRIMTPEEIGSVTNFNSWATLLGIIINLMLYGNSYVIAMNEYPDNRDKYTSVALFTSLISSILFLCIYFLFSNSISQFLNLNTYLVVVMFLGFMFLPATNMWFARQRYEYRYASVLLLSGIQAIISTFCAVIAVHFADAWLLPKPEARITATYAVSVSVGIVLTIHLFQKGKCFFYKKYAVFIVKVNTPTIIQALSKTVLDISDRLMIAAIVSKEALGIYGTIYSFASLPAIVWNAINTAILPDLFDGLNSIEQKEKKIQKLVFCAASVFSMLVVCFVLVMPELLHVFTTEVYIKESALVPPIVSGCYLTSLYSIFGSILLHRKKTGAVAWGTVIAACVNVFLNYVFIHLFGYYAAAYTTLIGYAVLVVCLYFSVKKVNNNALKVIKSGFLCAIFAVITILLLMLQFIYKFVLLRYVLLFAVVCFMTIYAKKVGLWKVLKGR